MDSPRQCLFFSVSLLHSRFDGRAWLKPIFFNLHRVEQNMIAVLHGCACIALGGVIFQQAQRGEEGGCVSGEKPFIMRCVPYM
jgi:hypothetical protein